VDQARTEARAEAEAAVEQRITAALALERAELVKQARGWLCMCGNRHVRSTAILCFLLLHCLCN
jgi:CDGSH-type Zn-finger protein